MGSSVLAFDVGKKRIGLAIANEETGFPSPLCTLNNGDEFDSELTKIIAEQEISLFVIGLPRSLSGEATEQTRYSLDFADKLKRYGIPIVMQDEALTSRKAEEELIAKNKSYKKGDIDALSATYILEDYIQASRHMEAAS